MKKLVLHGIILGDSVTIQAFQGRLRVIIPHFLEEAGSLDGLQV